MKWIVAVIGLGLMGSACAAAQEKGAWRAASKTADSITGDVYFTDEKIVINFASFTIAQIRTLEPKEMAAAFDLDAPPATGSGNLYRLSIPAAKKFLHKNTLCGAEDTQWIATYVSGKTLRMALFSGEAMPALTPEGMAGGSTLCGTFAYVR